jgi:formate C-acetyltransferase
MYLKDSTTHLVNESAGDTDRWRNGIVGWITASFIVGGVDKDGNDATNDLSFMFLDAMVQTRLANPWLAVRWHDKTPYEFKVKYANMVRLGIGHPKFFNDNTCIDAWMRKGVSLEDARDYANVGCVELDLPGKCCGWVDTSYFSIAKVFELAINNGSCIACAGELCPNNSRCKGAGKALGLETGYLKDFKTFDEVREAFEAQLKYWADRCIQTVEIVQSVHGENDDWPFLSSLIEGCTESGKTLNESGAKYNFTGINALGPATAADSLSAMKQVIYEDKIATPEEFYDALVNDWKGHERLYALVNSDKVRHYGNDDDEADAMMDYVIGHYCDVFQSYPPTRGGKGIINTGAFSQTINVMFGLTIGATPDGRKAHEPISENIGAARTAGGARDSNGPTAYARSISKIDHGRMACGSLINMKFGVDTISGEQGLQNFIDLQDGYFAQGPLHIQYMVTNRDTLVDAQKHPNDYKDLLVRVSGFSSFFHTLSTSFQDELINRTEHSFD